VNFDASAVSVGLQLHAQLSLSLLWLRDPKLGRGGLQEARGVEIAILHARDV
jgi:hypothetical protein